MVISAAWQLPCSPLCRLRLHGAVCSFLGLCAAQIPHVPALGLVSPPSTGAAGRHGSGSWGRSCGGCGGEAAERVPLFGLVTLPSFLQPTQAPAGAGVLLCKFSSYL